MSAVEVQLILQAVAIVVVLGGAFLSGYMRIVSRISEDKTHLTNRLTAIETKLDNGITTNMRHLLEEGDKNTIRIQENRGRLERIAVDVEDIKARLEGHSHARHERSE